MSDEIGIDEIAASAHPHQLHAALRGLGLHRDQRGRWVVATAEDVHAVLARHDVRVVRPSTGIPALDQITASMARFTDDEPHVTSRSIAVGVLDGIDPAALRVGAVACARRALAVTGELDLTALARGVAVEMLAATLGFRDLPATAAAVLVVASCLAPRDDVRGASSAVTAAVDHLVAAAPTDDPSIAANLIGLLFQATDATTGLVTNALVAAMASGAASGADAEALVLRAARFDSPVQTTRRIARERFELAGHVIEPGDELLLMLAAANADEHDRTDAPATFSFGAGAHACPGRSHAIAIAAGTVEAILSSQGQLHATTIAYERRANLRIVDALLLSTGAGRHSPRAGDRVAAIASVGHRSDVTPHGRRQLRPVHRAIGGTEMTDCAAIALALFDDWEKRDYDSVMAQFADGAVVRDHPRDSTLTAPSDIRGWMESWVIACEDATAGAKVAVSSPNGAVIQGTYAGTNTGPLGPLPATGRTVSMPFAIVLGFDGAGKVTTYDVYYDQYTLLSQLGHVPALA